LQKSIWKKEFDRYQTEPLVEIFKNILLVLNNNASTSQIKTPISQEILNKLKIEVQFIRYLNDDLRQDIQNDIYQKSLDYNDIIHKRTTTPEKSGTEKQSSEIIENENKREREKREEIEKAIVKVIDNLKSIYLEF